MSSNSIRWGILGTAQIARKNWQAIWHSGNGVVAAVASRDGERSRQFIAECQATVPFATAPRVVEGYAALVADPEIDALYIPLPTGLRKEWVLQAAAAGKHVVCEKPCAVSAADLREMITACRRHGVQFMDGVMFMHSRRLPLARGLLDDGKTVGPIRRMQTAFSFNAPEEFFTGNIRAQAALEPWGCVGDLGWYCVRLPLWAMNWETPREVTGRMLAATTPPSGGRPVPTEFSGELLFASGVSAGFYCSFRTELQQNALINGTRGQLQWDDFVLPVYGCESALETRNPAFVMTGCDSRMEPGHRRWSVPEYSNSHPTAQETNLFRAFADQVRTGHLNPAWPAMALQTQIVLEACLESARRDSRAVPVEGAPGMGGSGQ